MTRWRRFWTALGWSLCLALVLGVAYYATLEFGPGIVSEIPWETMPRSEIYWACFASGMIGENLARCRISNGRCPHPIVDDVFRTPDVVTRRRILEDVGFRQFMSIVRSEELDRDEDAAGMPRRLLRVRLRGEEPIVAVEVKDPSTGDVYYLRVPPATRTCKAAVAWTFRMDAREYRPWRET